jgi:hypothetical protein
MEEKKNTNLFSLGRSAAWFNTKLDCMNVQQKCMEFDDVQSAIGKPLNGQTRPYKRMREDEIVEKRCVFLPDLIFLIDDLLFHF